MRMKYAQFVRFDLVTILWLLCVAMPPQITAEECPPSEAILPCRCSLRGREMQIWCSHSNLPQIMSGIKAVENNIKRAIDELVLENNQLPALPGRFFGTLQIVRLMLRYNSIERVSNGWLNELENSLVEIYIVEPQLRSIPAESLNGMINMIAITIQSDKLKHLPNFSELLSLTYLSVQSNSLTEVQAPWFRHLPKLQNIHINGGPNMNRIETGQFDSLISLKNIDLSHNGINWIHLRAFSRLPNVLMLKLSYNGISDVGMVGRIVKDLENLKKLRIDHNIINAIEDGSFVDLPHLSELHLNDNRIKELQYGAFLRVPELKTIYLHNNHIKHIHPESFLQASGSGVESAYFYNNEIEKVSELRSLLDALPALKFLDISNNYITSIPYGALRGHGTLEQLHLNNNLLRIIEHDAFMAMPALRELRMRNNSLSNNLPMPFWNLPALKGLDLSLNNFRVVSSFLLSGLPSLRRLDLSENGLSILEENSFVHNPMLETLNISNNQLIAIQHGTFQHLHHLFEVDASHNQLTEFINGLPKAVERISLCGNFIASLPVPASKVLNLSNLRMLDLSSNHLEHLPKYSFQGTPQLRVLSLANNRLHALDDTTFIGARRLELLHLQENFLTHIDERSLLCLPEIKNLNLQGNKLESITDNMLSNNSLLEQLDLSRNSIRTISTAAFESQRSLEYLDLSGNALYDISKSLSNLISLQDIDLSYNQISNIHADVVSAWVNVLEIRLSNNVITALKHGTFRNLPKLQYLDLSSNEIEIVDAGALRHLPDLQELVLADNKLVELKDRVFEDLPNLLASHFQFNRLRYISTESFYNAPSMVFLNLSHNIFQNMESIGLRKMRNLEVLDLSVNGIKVISTMPLKALSWLVELKMDNNEICKIQGSPFEAMPRLKVLSLRNNRLRTIRERAFRNLRSNIAVLDVDGNPITCSCEMQWFSVWLQETNFPYPGPKCQDGRLLRTSRMNKSLCMGLNNENQRIEGLTNNVDNDHSNKLPLFNEHGDIFQRELAEELSDECDVFDIATGERPLAGESEYFYDQYVDYTPTNEMNSVSTQTPATVQLEPTNIVLNHHKTASEAPTINANINLNNTILNTNYIPQRTSPFTFFGYPISGLNFGRFFGAENRGRKYRGESPTVDAGQTSATMPATHRSSQRGKVRMLQPNSAEFEKYLKQDRESNYKDVTSRNSNLESGSDEAVSNEVSKSIFKTTAFREPSNVEHGGFRPIVPGRIGGFMPVHNPKVQTNFQSVNETSTFLSHQNDSLYTTERNYIPVLTETAPKQFITNKPENSVEETAMDSGGSLFSDELVEAQTYYVTEAFTESMPAAISNTESNADGVSTPSPITTTRKQGFGAEFYDDLDPESIGVLNPAPAPLTSTAETILLIPPSEEHVEEFKRHSWVSSTTLSSEISSQESATSTTAPNSTHHISRSSAGRSTIIKVFTPQTQNKFLPTAEEYQRTTTTNEPEKTYVNSNSNAKDVRQSEFHKWEQAENSSPYQVDRSDHKDGMEWYYDSFKMMHPSSNYDQNRHNPAASSSSYSATFFCNKKNSSKLKKIYTICSWKLIAVTIFFAKKYLLLDCTYFSTKVL